MMRRIPHGLFIEHLRTHALVSQALLVRHDYPVSPPINPQTKSLGAKGNFAWRINERYHAGHSTSSLLRNGSDSMAVPNRAQVTVASFRPFDATRKFFVWFSEAKARLHSCLTALVFTGVSQTIFISRLNKRESCITQSRSCHEALQWRLRQS